MARIPKAEIQAQIAKAAEPVPVAPPIKVPDLPYIPEDVGVNLYQDRAGAPINTGLTEGSGNFATITAEARRAAASPEK